jgi:hypothetical protein
MFFDANAAKDAARRSEAEAIIAKNEAASQAKRASESLLMSDLRLRAYLAVQDPNQNGFPQALMRDQLQNYADLASEGQAFVLGMSSIHFQETASLPMVMYPRPRFDTGDTTTASRTTAIGWFEDSLRFASGSADGSLHVWNAHDSSSLAVLHQAHTGAVTSITASPDGRRLVSGSEDGGTVHVWTVRDAPAADRKHHQSVLLADADWCDDGRLGTMTAGYLSQPPPPVSPPPPPRTPPILCTNECAFSRNGLCEDGLFDLCVFGTDCHDCGRRGGLQSPPPPPNPIPPPLPPGAISLCTNDCGSDLLDDYWAWYAGDGYCDDGGYQGFDLCPLGTDCQDCGERWVRN